MGNRLYVWGERKALNWERKLRDSLLTEALSWYREEGVLGEPGFRVRVGSGVTQPAQRRGIMFRELPLRTLGGVRSHDF